MNQPRQILKNTIALTIARLGELVGGAILFFYLARMLQVEGLGIYTTVMAVFQTVGFGCGVGFRSFIPRELPKDLSQTNRYLIHAGLVSLASALALLAGLDVLVPHLGYLPQTRLGIYIISLAFIPTGLQVVLDATFVAHQKAEFIAVTMLFGILGRILGSLFLLHLGFGVTSLIIVYTAFSYLMLFVTIRFLMRRIVIPRWEFDWPFLLEMLRKLKVFVGLALLATLFSQVEVVILSLTWGETQVGFYSAALKLIIIWAMVPQSYLTAIFPVLTAAYQESREKAVSIQNRSLKYILATAFPLVAGIVVAADAIISQFYGPGFEASVWVLGSLAWCLPFFFCNQLLWRILVARDEQHLALRGRLIAGVLQAFLALILTPRLGYQGAAWAFIGGSLAFAVYHLYYVERGGTSLPFIQLGWRFALASAVMGIFAWICARWVPLFVLVPLAAAVYVTLIVVLRAFSQDDLTLLLRILKRNKGKQPARQEAGIIDKCG
jgi:O-antigen/teichoic acid export membrane protein